MTIKYQTPNYFFSSFNVKIREKSQDFIYNTITNHRIQNATSFSNLLDKILVQQLDKIEESISGKILQLITTELSGKGIILPITEKENETEYLNSLVNFSLLKNSFFKCKNLTERELVLLENKIDNRIIFCGIPYDFGAGIPGARCGPHLLRVASESIIFRGGKGLLLDLEGKSNCFDKIEMYDIGNVNLPLNLKSQSLVKVKDLAFQIYNKGLPFFVGGDHLFSLPIIEAIYSHIKKPFIVIQLDYHLDVQFWGEFNSNRPCALTEPTHANFISWLKLKIPELEILQIGVHNYHSISEKTTIKEVYSYLEHIGTQISNTEILSSKKEDLLKKIPFGQNVYLTIDVDVLNRIYIPNTGYPSSLGISIADFYSIITAICKNNTLLGVDIMEFGSNNNYEEQSPMCEIIIFLMLQIIKNIKVIK